MGEGRGEGTGAYGVEMRARPEARVGLEVGMGLEVRVGLTRAWGADVDLGMWGLRKSMDFCQFKLNYIKFNKVQYIMLNYVRSSCLITLSSWRQVTITYINLR